jgi:hypothetical protein
VRYNAGLLVHGNQHPLASMTIFILAFDIATCNVYMTGLSGGACTVYQDP